MVAPRRCSKSHIMGEYVNVYFLFLESISRKGLWTPCSIPPHEFLCMELCPEKCLQQSTHFGMDLNTASPNPLPIRHPSLYRCVPYSMLRRGSKWRWSIPTPFMINQYPSTSFETRKYISTNCRAPSSLSPKIMNSFEGSHWKLPPCAIRRCFGIFLEYSFMTNE